MCWAGGGARDDREGHAKGVPNRERPRLELAAPAEVERLPVRSELADPMPAAGARLASFHMHRHERPGLLRLLVVRVGQNRLDRPRKHRRDRRKQCLLLRRLQRRPPPQGQQPGLEKDLVRVRVTDPGEELLVAEEILEPMSRKSRYRSSWRPSIRIVNTSVAGTGTSPSAIWNRPPSIGLMTSHRSEPPPPSSVAKTRCLPRRESETMRRAGSSFAKCSTGYRSMCAFLGLTVAAVISRPSSRGARRIRSASNSGSSGMEPRYRPPV